MSVLTSCLCAGILEYLFGGSPGAGGSDLAYGEFSIIRVLFYAIGAGAVSLFFWTNRDLLEELIEQPSAEKLGRLVAGRRAEKRKECNPHGDKKCG